MTTQSHWLLRLSVEAWLAASDNELALARAHIGERRRSVTHLRRAAGMACNAALVAWSCREAVNDDADLLVWGRSYLEHLRVVAEGEALDPLPEPVREQAPTLARAILTIPLTTRDLVPLGRSARSDLCDAIASAERFCRLCAQACEHGAVVPG